MQRRHKNISPFTSNTVNTNCTWMLHLVGISSELWTQESQRHLFTTHCCTWQANHSAMTHPSKISYESPVTYKYIHISMHEHVHIHHTHNLNPGTQTSVLTPFSSHLLPECIPYVSPPSMSRGLHLKHTQVVIFVHQLHPGYVSLSTKSWHLHISPIKVPSDMHANYDVASQLHPGPWINFSTISWPCDTSSKSRDFHLNQIQVYLTFTHARYLCLYSVQVPGLASPLHPSHAPPLTRSWHLHTNTILVTSHFHQGT